MVARYSTSPRKVWVLPLDNIDDLLSLKNLSRAPFKERRNTVVIRGVRHGLTRSLFPRYVPAVCFRLLCVVKLLHAIPELFSLLGLGVVPDQYGNEHDERDKYSNSNMFLIHSARIGVP